MNSSRRTALASGLAAAFIPRRVLGSERLNIAAVGVGGMGAYYVDGCKSENIVAFADVDHGLAAKTFAKYPAARTYVDYRRMLEKEKSIDAVIVGTPDHTHAAIALAAMELGKHVYCAKPMARTVAEVRAMLKASRESKVATQMSVQSCASDESLTAVEWVRSGAVGEVHTVHVWSDRPMWPQSIERPTETPDVPESLDWSLWLGAAPLRPYHPVYHPFSWRGWCDFGTGALGDMGCHALHVIVMALGLGLPRSVDASSASVLRPAWHGDNDNNLARARRVATPETYPAASIVTYDFGKVRVVWYDGGLKPPRPPGMPASMKLGGDGIWFHGTRGAMLTRFTGALVWTPHQDAPPKTLPRTFGHYREWIDAAKGGKPASCNFEFGALLTEIALLGTVAQRANRFLEYDAVTMRFRNDAEANHWMV